MAFADDVAQGPRHRQPRRAAPLRGPSRGAGRAVPAPGRCPTAPSRSRSTSPTDPENLYQVDQWFEPMRRLHERHHVTVLVAQLGSHRASSSTARPVPVHHAADHRRDVERVPRPPAGPGDPLRQPEPGELRGDALRRPGARVHLPRRVRQGLHVEQPAQGLRPRLHRRHGRPRADHAQADRLRRVARWSRSAGRRSTSTSPARRCRATAAPWCSSPPPGRATGRRCATPRSSRTARRWCGRSSRPGGTGWSTGRTRAPASRCARRRAAHDDIVEVLRDANSADPTAGHVVDVEGGFGWQLAAPTSRVMDISAVAYDWLATGKPLLVTRPAEPRAALPESGLVRELTLLRRRGCRARARDRRRGGRAPRRHARGPGARYFGDTTPGASMERFLDACSPVVAGARGGPGRARRSRGDRTTARAAGTVSPSGLDPPGVISTSPQSRCASRRVSWFRQPWPAARERRTSGWRPAGSARTCWRCSLVMRAPRAVHRGIEARALLVGEAVPERAGLRGGAGWSEHSSRRPRPWPAGPRARCRRAGRPAG